MPRTQTRAFMCVPALLCLLLLVGTPLPAEEQRELSTCVEKCADIAEAMVDQKRSSTQSRENASGTSATESNTVPAYNPNQVLDFLRMCPEVVCP